MEKERRKFKRFDAYMSVKYKAQEPRRISGISLSQDLSREGMKITSNEPIETGIVLDLEIDIPDDPKPVHTSGEIVWNNRLEAGEKSFSQGLKFMLMDPVDKFRILDYAYNNWLETKVNDFADPEEIPEIS